MRFTLLSTTLTIALYALLPASAAGTGKTAELRPFARAQELRPATIEGLLRLAPRQSCPGGSFCGGGCCEGSETCCTGRGCCIPGTHCCGDGACCDNDTYCDGGGCCPNGEVCSGGGGTITIPRGKTTTKAPPPPKTTRKTTTTTARPATPTTTTRARTTTTARETTTTAEIPVPSTLTSPVLPTPITLNPGTTSSFSFPSFSSSAAALASSDAAPPAAGSGAIALEITWSYSLIMAVLVGVIGSAL